jgi:hypothetical protein
MKQRRLGVMACAFNPTYCGHGRKRVMDQGQSIKYSNTNGMREVARKQFRSMNMVQNVYTCM